MTPLPDPLRLAWPRRQGSCLVRPVAEDDVDAIVTYRSLPDVVRYLTHPVLDRDAVVERVRARTRPAESYDRVLTRGLAVEVEGRVIGDAMMRIEDPDGDERPRAWIGYAFHPDAWGHGYATDTAICLVNAASELGLPVWADTIPGNEGSERVLEKAGLRKVGRQHLDAQHRNVFCAPTPPHDSSMPLADLPMTPPPACRFDDRA